MKEGGGAYKDQIWTRKLLGIIYNVFGNENANTYLSVLLFYH